MTTLEEMSSRVEIYSIDEAFCDLTGVRNCRDLTDLRQRVPRYGSEAYTPDCRGWYRADKKHTLS